MEVPFAPIPVKAMDKMNLAYELHITNFSRTDIVLTGVEVVADDAGHQLDVRSATPFHLYHKSGI